MSYQVRITETAKQDLREIAFYIAGHSMDNDIAKRFIMELRDQCNRLMDFPQGGALAKDRILRSFDFRYILHKDYLIFYSIDEAQKIVSVLAIFNSKKDYLGSEPFTLCGSKMWTKDARTFPVMTFVAIT